MVNCGPLAAEIISLVWGTPGNFNGFRVLAALLHGTLVVGISQTAALNRGRHLHSAGRPSCWATFLVVFNLHYSIFETLTQSFDSKNLTLFIALDHHYGWRDCGSACCSLCDLVSSLPHAVNCRRFCFWHHESVDCFVCVRNISGTAERVCNKFTWKT